MLGEIEANAWPEHSSRGRNFELHVRWIRKAHFEMGTEIEAMCFELAMQIGPDSRQTYAQRSRIVASRRARGRRRRGQQCCWQHASAVLHRGMQFPAYRAEIWRSAIFDADSHLYEDWRGITCQRSIDKAVISRGGPSGRE